MTNYKGTLEFYDSYLKLQEIKRAGWVMRNVPAERIESVADHTLQIIMLAITLCYELDLDFDISKLAQMSFISELGEIIIGDIPEVDPDCSEKKKLEKEAVKKVLSPLSGKVRDEYLNLWIEMEERKTPLAKFVYQVDKIDAILKAKKYSNDYNMQELFEEFYNHQVAEGTFEQGALKEMFEYLKR